MFQCINDPVVHHPAVVTCREPSSNACVNVVQRVERGAPAVQLPGTGTGCGTGKVPDASQVCIGTQCSIVQGA